LNRAGAIDRRAELKETSVRQLPFAGLFDEALVDTGVLSELSERCPGVPRRQRVPRVTKLGADLSTKIPEFVGRTFLPDTRAAALPDALVPLAAHHTGVVPLMESAFEFRD
jgi:hypothetical protein